VPVEVAVLELDARRLVIFGDEPDLDRKSSATLAARFARLVGSRP
jgi:hypothetical protein